MPSGDKGLSFSDIKEMLPDFIFWSEVQNLGQQVKAAGGPIRWVNKRIVQFLLGMIGAAVFGIVDYIELVWTTVTGAFVSAGAPVAPIITRAGTNVYVLFLDVHSIIRSAMGFAGPFAPILVLGLYAVVFYTVFLALRSAAPAVSDLLGSIPIIGSVLDSLLTFGIEFSDRLAGYIGGGEGG